MKSTSLNPPFEAVYSTYQILLFQVYLSLLPGMQIESVSFAPCYVRASMAWLALSYFSYLSVKVRLSEEKKVLIGNVSLCVFLCFCSFFHEAFLLLGRIQQDVSKVPMSSTKEPDIFVPFSTNLDMKTD